MSARADFQIRVRQYAPFTDIATTVIPDSGIDFASSGDGGTLSVSVFESIYQTLPTVMEIAVEAWANGAWFEFQDARFIIEKQAKDDRSPLGLFTLTGQLKPLWMMNLARLESVEPLRYNGVTVVPAKTVTGKGTTTTDERLTAVDHGFVFGDRVRVTDKGKADKLTQGSVLWVRDVTENTFTLGVSRGGSTRKLIGIATVKLELIRDLVLIPDHGFKDNEKVGVRAIDGSGLSEGSSYYVVRNQTNRLGLASKPGDVALELDTDTFTIFRDLDGQRLFKSPRNTPGYILGLPFNEAKDRGALKSIEKDFSGGSDSAGVAWKNYVTDEDGLPVGFNPGTTSLAQLSYLLDQGVAEFRTERNTLRLFNPGTGAHFAGQVGNAAEEAPLTVDLANLVNAITLRGEGPIQELVEGNVTGLFGRLEKQLTVSGVATISLARRLGQQAVSQGSAPLQQFQITEPATLAEYLPGVDYLRNDYVKARLRGAVIEQRVAEFVYKKDATGKTTATSVLGSTIVNNLSRIIKRVNGSSGGLASAGTAGFLLESDNRKAAKPLLTVTSSGTFNAAGLATSTVTGTWLPVTVDEDGLSLAAMSYEMWVRRDGDVYGAPVGATFGESLTVGPYRVGETLAVSVRAQSTSGQFGLFSDEVEIITLGPPDVPRKPTPPVLTSKLGTAGIEWDGLVVDDVLGNIPPENGFGYVMVERAPAETGPWVAVGSTFLGPGYTADGPLDDGSVVWYRLITVNTVGTHSLPSDVASVTIVGVDLGTLHQDVQDVLEALGTTANGKNQVVYSTDPATGTVHPTTGVPFADGDTWWQYSGLFLIASWSWVGGAFVARTLDNTMIATLDAGKINTGILLADRIGARSIVGNKIAAEAITAYEVAAHAITADRLVVGFVDGQLIQGATFQTAASGARVVINGSGIAGYNSASTVKFSVSTADGIMRATDAVINGTIYAIAGEIIGDLTMTTGRILMGGSGSIIAGSLAGKYAILDGGNARFLTQSSPGHQAYMSDAQFVIADSGVGSVQITSSFISYTGSFSLVGSFSGGSGASIVLDEDGTGELVRSDTVYNRTYSSGVSDVVITTFGTIGRMTSARKYKDDIQSVPPADDPFTILTLTPSSWRDKAAVARAQGDGRDWEAWSREWGVIAEDVAETGLEHLVERGGDGQIEGVHYKMFGLAMLEPVRAIRDIQVAHDARIRELERRLSLLEP